MTRHQRNCTAGSVYSYHERKRDSATSGYGSKKARLAKDSVKDFDCCCLTLQPCENPVVTLDGYVYDKEAILEYILKKKQDIAAQMKEYENQLNKIEAENNSAVDEEKQKKLESFIKKESSIITKPINPFSEAPPTKKLKVNPGSAVDTALASTSKGPAGKGGKKKELPSFWIPSLTPDAKPALVKKPDTKVYCPMSGKPLKMKDLISFSFKPVNDRDSKTHILNKQERYVCAVTNDALSNSTPCAVLKTSGSVVTMECVEKLIRKDMVDPINGKKLTDKDIIPLQRGGTGFSGSGVQLDAKKAGAVMPMA